MHATPNVVRPCLPSKGDDGIRCLTPSDCVSYSKGGDGMTCQMSFDRVCYPKALMACHARRRSSCLNSKGYDGMPHRTSFDCMCSPKAVMECHARRLSTVCALQRQLFHVTPDVVRPCLPSKGYDGMPRPTSFGHVCNQKAVMSCHDRRNLPVCAYQGQL